MRPCREPTWGGGSDVPIALKLLHLDDLVLMRARIARRCHGFLRTKDFLRRTLQFSRVSPIEDIQVWNAASDGFSFVISFASRSGPGFRGNPGFVASWRPIHQNSARPF